MLDTHDTATKNKNKKRNGHRTRQQRNLYGNGLAPYLAHYLDWLTVKGYSPETYRRKDSVIRQFIQWCDERGLHDPKVITKPILESYQRYLFYLRQDNGHPLSIFMAERCFTFRDHSKK